MMVGQEWDSRDSLFIWSVPADSPLEGREADEGSKTE